MKAVTGFAFIFKMFVFEQSNLCLKVNDFGIF